MKRRKKWKKHYILIILAGIFFVGTLWQSIMTKIESNRYPPVGGFVDLGSYQAHYYNKGEGKITYVFITGSGTPCAYTDFFHIQNELAKTGQTISFDHAGSGWSSNTEEKRDNINFVKELSILIDKVANDNPVILVCHSLGSLEAIAYAQRYGDRVRGIIFLDAGSPEYYRDYSELAAKMLNRGTAFLRTIGMNRLLGEIGVLLPLYGENIRNNKLPEDIAKIDKVMYYRLVGNVSTLDTINQMNENADAICKGKKLGKLPILVLSSDSDQKWNTVQEELTAWSSESKHITVKESSHYIHWSKDKEVLQYIEDFSKNNIK